LLIELRSYNNSFFGEEGKKLLANPYLHKVGVHKISTFGDILLGKWLRGGLYSREIIYEEG
jgi:hypothetical protein